MLPKSARSSTIPVFAALAFAMVPARSQSVINLGSAKQTIAGFGGMNLTEPGEQWKIEDLTPAQAELAFGKDEGQLGLSLLRIRVPFNAAQWEREVRTAKIANEHGVKVFATPWSAPAKLKTNNSTVGGKLSTSQYGAYADHLTGFAKYMADHEAPLYAISVQNEPDISVTYESMDWSAQELINFLSQQGSKFGDLKVIAPESFQMRTALMDPILNNAAAAQHLDIVGGHIYGAGLAPYPLAQQKGKELWMTEHFTTSDRSANLWPDALEVPKEVHQVMGAGFNAYVWWYIRRSYGLLTEDGKVSKRGYAYSQFARFVRPGFVRVDVAASPKSNVLATAYRKDQDVVVVLLNTGTSSTSVDFKLTNGTGVVESFRRFTTSATKNAASESPVPVANNAFTVALDAQSITTLVHTAVSTSIGDAARRPFREAPLGVYEILDPAGTRVGRLPLSTGQDLASEVRKSVPRPGLFVARPVSGASSFLISVPH